MTTRAATVALLLAAAAGVAGCSRTVEPEPPAARYATLDPRDDLPAFMGGTVLESVEVAGTQPQALAGYGLVVNLENTGRDDGVPSAVRQRIIDDSVRRGVDAARTDGPLGALSPAALLADPRTAVVRVDGVIPPGAVVGQRVDVQVTALDSNTTPSLARGFLWQTELHSGIVNAQNPGEQTNLAGVARGPLVVNPGYALLDPAVAKDDASAVASLRRAVIPDGGVTYKGRPFLLRLRQPSRRLARMVEQRINYHFGLPVAAAQDEAVVRLEMPTEGPWANRGPGDWQHFVGVATHLYFAGGNDAFAATAAKRLADAARQGNLSQDELESLSYALEGLGQVALPQIVPLMADPDPAVAFAAQRAAAHLNQSAAADALLAAANDSANPYGVRSARELGRVEGGGRSLVRRVRGLLDSGNPQVRVAAYESLVRLDDPALESREVAGKFLLRLTPAGTFGGRATRPPLVYATLAGTPTIAVIGGERTQIDLPRLRENLLARGMGDRLTLSRPGDQNYVTLFQRLRDPLGKQDNRQRDFVEQKSLPDLIEVVGRLGGEAAPGEPNLQLGYGEVVALLKQMADDGQIVSGPGEGETVSVALQDASLNEVDAAPSVPGFEARRAAQASAAE